MKLVAFLFCTLFAKASFCAPMTMRVAVLDYTQTNVGKDDYVTVTQNVPYGTASMEVCDTSGQVLKIAAGSVNSEVDICTTSINGCIIIPTGILPASRVSVKALTGIASTGMLTVSYFR